MISWIIALVWFIGTITTYRRVGFVLENTAHSGHEYQGVCDACMCKNCGGRWGHHFEFTTLGSLKTRQCIINNNFEFKTIPHFRTYAAFIPTIAFWPLLMLGYGLYMIDARLGLHKSGSFFTPPPVVESREAKQERRLMELETENARLEKELGIGAGGNK